MEVQSLALTATRRWGIRAGQDPSLAPRGCMLHGKVLTGWAGLCRVLAQYSRSSGPMRSADWLASSTSRSQINNEELAKQEAAEEEEAAAEEGSEDVAS